MEHNKSYTNFLGYVMINNITRPFLKHPWSQTLGELLITLQCDLDNICTCKKYKFMKTTSSIFESIGLNTRDFCMQVRTGSSPRFPLFLRALLFYCTKMLWVTFSTNFHHISHWSSQWHISVVEFCYLPK